MTALTSPLHAATSERSRAALFDQPGADGFAFIGDPDLRASWSRCASHRAMTDRVSFDKLPPSRIVEGLERHEALTQDFRAAVAPLAADLGHCGLHAVLTDERAMILASSAVEAVAPSLRPALEIGADMSEAAIGTAGMNFALSSGRAVQVLAGEHYLLGNAGFHCTAAPIFDPDGRLVGALNLTRRGRAPLHGALAVVRELVARIELHQLRRLRGRVLKLHLGFGESLPAAALSVGPDGEILGLTQTARELLGLPRPLDPSMRFEHLFDAGHAQVIERLRRADRVALRLSSGLPVDVCEAPLGAAVAVAVEAPHPAPPADAATRPAAPELGAAEPLPRRAAAASPVDPGRPATVSLTRLADVEGEAIAQALRRTHGNLVQAAALLGISRSTLQRRLRERRDLARIRQALQAPAARALVPPPGEPSGLPQAQDAAGFALSP